MSKLSARKSRKVSTQRSKNKSWKSIKLLKQAESFVKLVVLAFFAIVVSIGILAGASFYNIIKSPLAASFSSKQKLDSIFTISFIEVEDKTDQASKVESLTYVVVNTLENKILLYKVPVDIELDLPERYGRGSISKAFAIGELVEKNKGIDLVNKTLAKVFARKADRYILTDKKGLSDLSNLYKVGESKDFVSAFSVRNLPKIKDAAPIIREYYESNLTPKEVLEVTKFFSTSTGSQVSEMSLQQ